MSAVCHTTGLILAQEPITADGDKAGDNELILKLDPGTETYRWVMLWVTTPPAAGTTVRFNEIRLYR